ncbi:MAG: ATP-dependent DNA helicase, partial [archaeon]
MIKIDTIEDVLGKNGLMNQKLPYYEYREEQIKCSKNFDKGIKEKKHVFIEAGTGTGKSFAYLIPAIINAKKENKKVAVCTHTISLQDQIIEKDIPILQKVLSDELPFNVAILKGRRNYLCKKKIDDLKNGEEFKSREDINIFNNYVLKWDKVTETGDKKEAPEKIINLWSMLHSDQHECKGKKCKFSLSCYLNKARAKQKTADLVILSHAAYFMNLKLKTVGSDGFLENFDVVIFDEGHHIEDAISSSFETKISYSGTIYLINEFIKLISKFEDEYSKITNSNKMITRLKTIREHMKNFWQHVINISEKDKIRLPGNKRLLDSKELAKMLKLFDLAFKESGKFLYIVEGLEKYEDKIDAIRKKIANAKVSLDIIATRKYKLDYAYWISKNNNKYNPVDLFAAPIKIKEFLDEPLFEVNQKEKSKTILITSATLTTNNSFDFLLNQFGLNKKDVITGIVKAPFNYPKQCVCYVPKNGLEGSLATYKPDEYYLYVYKQIKNISEISNRGIFALFT